jgi:predicted ATPase
MLFLFDNFEQVVAAAPVAAELLAAAPRIKMMVTSRIALQLRGEHEVPVFPLGLPSDGSSLELERLFDSESVKLFVQQAKAIQPGFELTPENAGAVAEICRRLDGLPLAIEIAAARVKMLPPRDILKRLDRSLRLLVGGAVDLPARHQTLRSAIDWSYELLKPEERSLFACLSVFAGGFNLESAESVCGPEGELDTFSGVEALLNYSLLRRVDSVAGDARFDMLQTIREYAIEKLDERGELEEFRRAHATYFTGKAVEMSKYLYRRDTVAWLAAIDEEHDNFRAALSWGLEGGNNISVSVQICSFLFWFWYRYGHFHEGRDWCERAMAGTESTRESPFHAVTLVVAGMMAMWEGDLFVADRRAEEAIRILELLGNEAIFSQARMGYGVILINQGRDREAHAELTRAAELFDQLGDSWSKATTLVHLANAALGLGEYEEARKYLDQAWPAVEAIGDRWQVAFCLNNYGEVARAQGDYEKAEGYYQRTGASFRDADALGDQARLIHTSGYLALHRGEIERARELFCESLERFRELGNRRGIAECLAGLAGAAAEEGRSAWAAPLLAAAEGLLTGSGAAWWPADRVEVERARERLRSSLEAGEFEALWERGRKMGLEESIAYAVDNSDVHADL